MLRYFCANLELNAGIIMRLGTRLPEGQLVPTQACSAAKLLLPEDQGHLCRFPCLHRWSRWLPRKGYSSGMLPQGSSPRTGCCLSSIKWFLFLFYQTFQIQFCVSLQNKWGRNTVNHRSTFFPYWKLLASPVKHSRWLERLLPKTLGRHSQTQ